MYTPAQFEETDVSALHALMRAHPLATLITQGAAGIDADHIPLLLVESGSATLLRGHVARGNPLWQTLSDDSEVLAIFHGPNCYVSPNWYVSKHEHGRVVPTWNYLVVHARGRIRWRKDPAWLRQHVGAATEEHEVSATPWTLADAPPHYIERMLARIVGFEIRVAALEGKWKLSQNRAEADRLGVVAGLMRQQDSIADEMAKWMRRKAAR
jgi:transcriptional regulator